MAKYDGLFEDWSEAYDLCREVNRPIVATVTENGITETCKIYPSGSCKVLLTTLTNKDTQQWNY